MIPCNCCPLGLTRCSYTYTDCEPDTVLVSQSTTSPVPNQTLVTANPNGIGTINLAATADGNTAGGSYGGFNTNAGNATNLIMEYRWNVAVDRAVQIRLWNNGGGNLNDGDGIGTALVTLLDGAGAQLWQGNLVAGNGGAIFTTELNGVSIANQINGIRRMRLQNITNLAGGAPDILWRNINLRLTYLATLTFVCGPNTITATVEGVNAGLAIPGAGLITQTNGPHTLTFSSLRPFTGSIVTNRPADFSQTTNIQSGTVVTMIGNHANTQFQMNFEARNPSDQAQPAFGMICDGVAIWYDTNGEPVDATELVDCT